jgi:Uma2 family endonuclease
VTQALPRRHYTFHDYLILEQSANVRHEFLDGEIYAMAGGTPQHAAISMNVGATLNVQLRGKPCRVHSSDLRIRVPATGLVAYPDVSVVCGHVERDPEDTNTIVNPVVIVEVLSPSTEEYDRYEKLAHYKQLASLSEVLLVAHSQKEVEHWRRGADGQWAVSVARSTEVIALTSVGCTLDVEDIYRDELEPR